MRGGRASRAERSSSTALRRAATPWSTWQLLLTDSSTHFAVSPRSWRSRRSTSSATIPPSSVSSCSPCPPRPSCPAASTLTDLSIPDENSVPSGVAEVGDGLRWPCIVPRQVPSPVPNLDDVVDGTRAEDVRLHGERAPTAVLVEQRTARRGSPASPSRPTRPISAKSAIGIPHTDPSCPRHESIRSRCPMPTCRSSRRVGRARPRRRSPPSSTAPRGTPCPCARRTP